MKKKITGEALIHKILDIAAKGLSSFMRTLKNPKVQSLDNIKGIFAVNSFVATPFEDHGMAKVLNTGPVTTNAWACEIVRT
jgi:hypothetical protein